MRFNFGLRPFGSNNWKPPQPKKMYQNWLDYNQDTLPEGTRQTKKINRFEWVKHDPNSSFDQRKSFVKTGEYEKPIISRSEILDQVKDKLNSAPLKWSVDPKTGKTVASRSIGPVARPQEFAGSSKYNDLWDEGAKLNFVLPKGFDTSNTPKFTSRRAPLSDRQRTSAYDAGVEGIQNQNVTRVIPNSYIPESALMAQTMSDGTPSLNSTVDYSTGNWYRNQGNNTFGQFNNRFFGPVNMPVPQYSNMTLKPDALKAYQSYKTSGYQGQLSFDQWLSNGKPIKENQ